MSTWHIVTRITFIGITSTRWLNLIGICICETKAAICTTDKVIATQQ
jgi:hypothetical protein